MMGEFVFQLIHMSHIAQDCKFVNELTSTLKNLPFGQLLLLHAKICLELSCLSNGKEIPTEMQVAPQYKLITLLALVSLLYCFQVSVPKHCVHSGIYQGYQVVNK